VQEEEQDRRARVAAAWALLADLFGYRIRQVLRCSLKKLAADGASEDLEIKAGRGIRYWA
jgi:hypothetical protein